MSETQRWIGGLSALVGAWVFVSTFVFGLSSSHFWNNVVIGAAIVILAGYSAVQASESRGPNPWASGLAALLGLWMIVAPFVFQTAGSVVLWSDVLSGAVVAVLSGYNAYEERDALQSESAGRTA